MGRLRETFLTLIWFAAIGAACGQTKANPFSLAISTDRDPIKLGSDVDLRIAMTNLSTHDVDCSSVYAGAYDLRFQIDVRDEAGQSVKQHHPHPERFPLSLQMCTLSPGKTITHESRISWQHDFSRPGTYEIQASRNNSSDKGEDSISSNKITITVTP
jgi:hypothetical protein